MSYDSLHGEAYNMENCHAVRRMAICAECGEPGVLDATPYDDLPALLRIGRGKKQQVKHAMCFELSTLMVLSREELEHVRINDVSSDVMECILSTLKYRREFGHQ